MYDFHSFIVYLCLVFVFLFKQKTAYEMRISDWSSDVCSSDLLDAVRRRRRQLATVPRRAVVVEDDLSVKVFESGHVLAILPLGALALSGQGVKNAEVASRASARASTSDSSL